VEPWIDVRGWLRGEGGDGDLAARWATPGRADVKLA
jgi:hypothetical protein